MSPLISHVSTTTRTTLMMSIGVNRSPESQTVYWLNDKFQAVGDWGLSVTSSAVTAKKAFLLISKGWREVKDSTEADLQLMKDKAKSFKNLASSFDREFENFLTFASRSTFPVPAIENSSSLSPPKIDFMKKLQPKHSEFRRAYSSPDFSKRVLETTPNSWSGN